MNSVGAREEYDWLKWPCVLLGQEDVQQQSLVVVAGIYRYGFFLPRFVLNSLLDRCSKRSLVIVELPGETGKGCIADGLFLGIVPEVHGKRLPQGGGGRIVRREP